MVVLTCQDGAREATISYSTVRSGWQTANPLYLVGGDVVFTALETRQAADAATS